MMMYAVCVTLEIHETSMTAFRPLIETQAQNSLSKETDCHRFDICLGSGTTVFLYELYTDAAAFQRHLETPHFKAFDAAVAELVAQKTVLTFETVIQHQ